MWTPKGQSTIPVNDIKAEEEASELMSLDEALEIHQMHRQRHHQKRRGWGAIALSLLFGSIFASLFWWTTGLAQSYQSDECPRGSFVHRPTPGSPHEYSRECGHSPEEARALSCMFQLWSYSWVPEACFDGELHHDFLEMWSSRGNWGYFSKANGTAEDEVPLSEVLAGDRNDLFSTWGQHYWHCAYYQRKFFRMMGEGGVESRVGVEMMTNRDEDVHHTLHCQEWLANPFKYEWSKVNINLTIGYHSC